MVVPLDLVDHHLHQVWPAHIGSGPDRLIHGHRKLTRSLVEREDELELPRLLAVKLTLLRQLVEHLLTGLHVDFRPLLHGRSSISSLSGRKIVPRSCVNC